MTPDEDDSLRLQHGLILDGAPCGALSEAPIHTLATGSGDQILATTHPGHGYKSVNEDRIALIESAHGDDLTTGLFVVDGMGGHQRGDVSAALLSEELVRALGLGSEEVMGEAIAILRQQIDAEIGLLPDQGLTRAVRSLIESSASHYARTPAPKDLLWSAIEAVQIESIQLDRANPDKLRIIAEVLRALSDLRPADTIEIAIQRTRRRIGELGYKADAPDACFTGAVLRASPEGRKTLEVKQIGDCKLVVTSAAGKIRFQTIGESMIPEPDLRRPDITLTELMSYSLHRNIVTNSVYSQRRGMKRYRRDDLPLELHPGDSVYIYSDGVDDLFTPEELIRLRGTRTPAAFIRLLLRVSEYRMRYVDGLIAAEQRKLGPAEQIHAYPKVHQLMNESRLDHGHYLERYPDGSLGRWTKPPKCDNTAFCLLVVGPAAEEG